MSPRLNTTSLVHVRAFTYILSISPGKASKFIRQKQYYDNINTKYKQYNGRLPEGNPSIELVAYSKIYCYNINSEEKEALGANI